jgi:5-methylcytosine-specific restriction endonuclease McrA
MSDVLHLNADGQPLSMLPLSAIPWWDAVRLVYQEKAMVLKEYDEWIVRSQYLVMKVPSIIIASEQIKYNKQLKYSSGNIYLRDDFTCQLQTSRRCKAVKGKVAHTELTLDHVVPRSLGGKTNWINCCAACKECNSEKGNDPTVLPIVKPWKPSYFEILAKRKKFPLHVRDEAWLHYIAWPSEMTRVLKQPGIDGK